MNKKQLILVLLGLFALNGCAGRNNIVLDPQGLDMGQYQADLAQCEKFSRQANSKAGKGMVGGAIVGAIAGNIVGNSKTRRNGAKLGALGGLVKGAVATKRERQLIVKNCLRNRGYAVLN